jgi:D-xylose transport system substrate-binding protein
LLSALGAKAANGQILWINGPVADNNAVMYKQGAHSALDGKVRVAAEYTMSGPAYDPPAVAAWLKRVLPTIDKRKIVGAYCVDDNSAGLVAAAFTAAGISPIPPITGHNADIAGLQRMLVGTQYLTVYKPVRHEAELAADAAYALLRGQRPAAPTSVDNGVGHQPAMLLQPRTVTRDNLKSTVLSDEFVTRGALCAAAYVDACRAAGLL